MGSQAIGLALGICIGLAAGLTIGYADFGAAPPDAGGLASDLGGPAHGTTPGASGDSGAAPLPNGDVAQASGPTVPDAGSPTLPEASSDAPDGAGATRTGEGRHGRTGSGAITVRVSHTNGKPLAGVVVDLIETSGGATQATGWRRGDPSPAARGAADTRNVFVSRRTSADGHVRFAKLPEGSTYVVAGFARGFDVRRTDATAVVKSGYYSRQGRFIKSTKGTMGNQYTVAIGSHTELVALPVKAIATRLRLPDGSSPDHAILTVKSVRGTETQYWTRGIAELRLTPGVYRVSASVGGAAAGALEFGKPEYSSEEISVAVPEQGAAPAVTISLELRTGIQGRVSGLPNEHAVWVYVWAMEHPGGGEIDEAKLRKTKHRTWIRGTTPVFAFRNLTPGTWAVGVSPPSKNTEVAAMQTVQVTSGMAPIEFTLDTTRTGVLQKVLVLGPDGTPVVDVKLTLRLGSGKAVKPSSRSGTSDGRHEIMWPSHLERQIEKAKQPQPLRLWATSPRFGTTVVETALDQPEVTIQFAEAAMLEVTITGYSESGHAGRLQVAVASGAWKASDTADPLVRLQRRVRAASGKVDAQGKYLYGPSSPGRARITLQILPPGSGKARRGNTVNAATETIDLASGMNRVTLSLPSLHSVTVAVPGARPGHTVRLNSADGKGFNSPQVDASSGQASFAGLPAGQYWVNVWNNETAYESTTQPDASVGTMMAEVPGSGVIHFQRVPEDAAHVSLWDEAEGPMATAGFKDEDQIIAVNGKGFDGHVGFVKLVSGATGATVSFTVLRSGGTTLQLKLNRVTLIAGLADDGETTQADIWVGSRNE